MDYENYECILTKRKGRVLCLTLNRPDSLNAVTAKMHEELTRIFYDIRNDTDADVVTITGAGRAFCAGADLKEPILEKAAMDKIFVEARDLVLHILEIDKPIISGVNGAATGLGSTLALLPDIVIASDKARIGDTHVKVGLAAGDGGCVILPLLVGVNKAKELLMTGQVLNAQEAEKIGLVNHVVPHDELESAMMAKANELAAGAQPAIKATKKAVNLYLKWMCNQVFDYSLQAEYQCASDLLTQLRGA